MEKYNELFGVVDPTRQGPIHDEQPLAKEVMPYSDGVNVNAEVESGPTTGDQADRPVISDATVFPLDAKMKPTAAIKSVALSEPLVVTHNLRPQIQSIIETETAGTAVPADEGHAVQPEPPAMHADIATPISDLEVSTSLSHAGRGEAPTTFRSAVTGMTTTQLL